MSGDNAARHNPRDVNGNSYLKTRKLPRRPVPMTLSHSADVCWGAPTRHGTRTAFVHQMVLTLELVAATSHYISNHRKVDLKPATELCECK